MIPLFLSDALGALGAPGWAVVVATVGMGLYHFRRIMGVLATLSTVTKIGVGFVGALVIISTGLVPGIEVELIPDVLLPWLGGLLEGAVDAVTGLV
jgi:hypothetical protein